MMLHTWTLDQALAFLFARRPIVSPNRGFRSQLSKLEQRMGLRSRSVSANNNTDKNKNNNNNKDDKQIHRSVSSTQTATSSPLSSELVDDREFQLLTEQHKHYTSNNKTSKPLNKTNINKMNFLSTASITPSPSALSASLLALQQQALSLNYLSPPSSSSRRSPSVNIPTPTASPSPFSPSSLT
jgi:hypothetical protein